MIGIRMGIAQAQKRYSPPKAAFKAAGQTVRQAKMWWLGLYSLFSGEISHRELTGPIGIYLMTEEVAKEGAVELVIFLAKISIILGLVNLVPLPVLDGGNLVVFALEGIRGKPFSARVMTVIQQIGLAIIALLFLLVIYNDVFYRLLGR
jgi:regulator of sigma E protease